MTDIRIEMVSFPSEAKLTIKMYWETEQGIRPVEGILGQGVNKEQAIRDALDTLEYLRKKVEKLK